MSAPLPSINDPTLEAVNEEIELREKNMPPRPYLGMSEIGNPCLRSLWYSFRWCSNDNFSAATLKLFEDGHRTEELEANRLSMVPAINLATVDNRTGDQIACTDFGGHFQGHLDGVISGLIQKPTRPHVWEHKCVNETKQRELDRIKSSIGEERVLKKWDETYYAQAQLYMHYTKIDKHYLTVSTPGGRHTISCFSKTDPAASTALKTKAHVIISATEPPPKLSTDPSWFKCKWCRHANLCHEIGSATVSCRTCIHAMPQIDGDARWNCQAYSIDLSLESVQRRSHKCPRHLFVPALLGNWAEPLSQTENEIKYKNTLTGSHFFNGEMPGHYSSKKIASCKNKGAIGDTDGDSTNMNLTKRTE